MNTDALETEWLRTATELAVPHSEQSMMLALIGPLKKTETTREHYKHSLRVGLLGAQVADAMILSPRSLFFAGTLHDAGKTRISPATLGKTKEWTAADAQYMESHVMLGYEIIKDRFPGAADIMVAHHTFQKNSYPKELPPLLDSYDEQELADLREFRHLLAIVDQYDAMHRKNSKYPGGLSGTDIKERLLEEHAAQAPALRQLYRRHIFTEET